MLNLCILIKHNSETGVHRYSSIRTEVFCLLAEAEF